MNAPYQVLYCTSLEIANNLARTLLIFYMGAALQKKLHDSLVKKILNAPINKFFDVTPIGYLLNIFARDLERANWSSICEVAGFLSCFYSCLNKILIAYAVVPVLSLFLIVNFTAALSIVLYVRKGRLHFIHLQHQVDTSQLSKLTTNLQGVSVIRAFNKQTQVGDEMQQMLERQALTRYFYASV